MPREDQQIREKFKALSPVMSERMRRLWAGAEAESLGAGGIAQVMRATGMSRTTIRAGRDQLRAEADSILSRRAKAIWHQGLVWRPKTEVDQRVEQDHGRGGGTPDGQVEQDQG